MRQIELKYLLTVITLSFVLTVNAQVIVSGQVTGNDAPGGLTGALVVLESDDDYCQTRTEDEGLFSLTDVQGSEEGINYSLTIDLHGYERHYDNINVHEQNINLGVIVLREHAWPPRNVEINLNAEADTMFVEWNTPQPSYLNEGWFHWDAGYNMGDAIGTGQAGEFIVVQRFTPESLEHFNVVGLSITSVRFFPNEADASYTVKIYQGGSADPLEPGEEIVSQLVEEIDNEDWNRVDLEEPVEITGEQELWIGYHVNTMGGHPLGCDHGPAVNNYGNIINIEGQWTTLLSIDQDLNYNWNIHAFAGRTRGDRSVLLTSDQSRNNFRRKPEPEDILYGDDEYSLMAVRNSSRPTRKPVERTSQVNQTRVLEGYNIFRLTAGEEESPEDWDFLAETADTVFADSSWADLEPGMYRYAVQAIYTDEVLSEYVISDSQQNELLFDLSGRVIASDTDEGLVGAFIRFEGLENYATISEEDGNFIIRNVLGSVEPVRYELNVTKNRYVEHNSNHDVTNSNINLGNITLYVESYPPRKMNAEINENQEVDLNWYPPAPGFPQWLHWDSGENNDAVGTGDRARFRAVVRFSREELQKADVEGLYLTGVRFFPTEEAASYTIKVWADGGINPLDPGREITSQPVEHFEVGRWNEINLDEPVEILPNIELWFGYEVDTPRGFPAGADEGPHKDYYGNIIYIGNNWQTLYELNEDLTYNWNIQGFAGHNDGDRGRKALIKGSRAAEQIDPVNLHRYRNSISNFRLDVASNYRNYPAINTDSRQRKTASLSRTDYSDIRYLEEYQIFRFKTEDRYDPENWQQITVQQDTSYTDTHWNDLSAGIYQYAVKAAYANDTLSDPTFSNILLKDMYCQVKIEVTSNSGDPVDGAFVTLTNIDDGKRYIYSNEVAEDGYVTFTDVWRGTYKLTAELFGFERYTEAEVDVNNVNFKYEIELIEALYPVANLEYEIFNDNNVILRWEEPGSDLRTEQWIQWDDRTNYDAIGTNGPIDFMVAARFTPEIIEKLNIEGLFLERIRFFPFEPTANYTLKVWRNGSGTPLWAGEEIVSQPVNNIVNNEWNEVPLEEPVKIPADEEIWFGYKVTTQTGYPAGIDRGPAQNRYGNLIYINNQWRTLVDLNPNFNNNWNLGAYAADLENDDGQAVSRRLLQQRSSNNENDKSVRKLLGFKVYRDEQLLEDNLKTMTYRDISIPIGSYKYSVVAQYTTGNSQPVSTEEVVILSADEESIRPPARTELISNYPNPFNPETTITFSLHQKQRVNITIHNLKGQKVKTILDKILPAGNHSSTWDGRNDSGADVGSGLYLYRMETNEYSERRKMLLLR